MLNAFADPLIIKLNTCFIFFKFFAQKLLWQANTSLIVVEDY